MRKIFIGEQEVSKGIPAGIPLVVYGNASKPSQRQRRIHVGEGDMITLVFTDWKTQVRDVNQYMAKNDKDRVSEAERINTAIDDALNYMNRGQLGVATFDPVERKVAEYMLRCIRRDDGSMAFHWVRFDGCHIDACPTVGNDWFTIATRNADDRRYYRKWDWDGKQA